MYFLNRNVCSMILICVNVTSQSQIQIIRKYCRDNTLVEMMQESVVGMFKQAHTSSRSNSYIPQTENMKSNNIETEDYSPLA